MNIRKLYCECGYTFQLTYGQYGFLLLSHVALMNRLIQPLEQIVHNQVAKLSFAKDHSDMLQQFGAFFSGVMNVHFLLSFLYLFIAIRGWVVNEAFLLNKTFIRHIFVRILALLGTFVSFGGRATSALS